MGLRKKKTKKRKEDKNRKRSKGNARNKLWRVYLSVERVTRRMQGGKK